MKKITLVIPLYNEENNLENLVTKTTSITKNMPTYQFQFLFINDGSTDGSLSVLRRLQETIPEISIVNFSRNFGKEAAMLAGFDYSDGDAVIIMDADLQHPPDLIPELVREWENGYIDIYAKRQKRHGESALKKLTSHHYYRILERLSDVPVQRDTGDFRLLDRQAVEAIKLLRESKRYTKGMYSWIGFNKKEILYDAAAREDGASKWNYNKLMDLALEGITSSTILPLRFASWSGIFVSIAAFLYIVFLLIRTSLYGDPVAGYPSMLAIILFLGGMQLLALGIIGEYLGKIFIETKSRPTYIVESVTESAVKKPAIK